MGLAEDGGGKCFPSLWSAEGKPCDYCNSSAAVLFCRTDWAFMCMGCDSNVHGANSRRHERVWMCEVCEQAPASVTCKADAAALCVTCDRDIHSANHLSRRHDRIPVVPFYDSAESVVKSTAATFLLPAEATDMNRAHESFDSSCILSNQDTPKAHSNTEEVKSMEFLFSDSGQLINYDYFQQHQGSGTDSVVPVQPPLKQPVQAQIIDHSPENYFEIIDFTRSNLSSYNSSYAAQSLTHSVSTSSLDVGVVPDGSSVSEISYPFGRNISNGVDTGGSVSSNQASQLVGMDREARVSRYREKKKNRKFEKTIRYASRKAYAETRPRIKGRFAKRTEIEGEVDRIFPAASVAFVADSCQYGVVPSF